MIARHMHPRRLIRWAGAVLALVAATLLAGCVAGEVGYADGGPYPGAGYGLDYYEPYGFAYGGWDGGYWVGPHGRDDRRGALRGAGPGRRVPSIPIHPRAGGIRGGGPGRR